jgi:hypothetical protein
MPISTIDNTGLANLSSAILNSNGRPMVNTTGGILQVVQVTKTDAMVAVAGAIWANVPGQGGSGSFQATITPSSTSSKILIIVDMKGAGVAGSTVIRSRLLRGSTPIYYGDAGGSSPQGISQFYCTDAASGAYYVAQLGGSYLDSPATTSAVTYNMQYGSDNTGTTSYINRTQGNRGTAYDDILCAASIILMEIAG